MPPIHVFGMRGLGDCINQRPFVKTLVATQDVYLQTPWPELFADLPVRFVREVTTLRTQAKNVARQPATRWATVPPGARQIRISYGTAELKTESIIAAMERCFGVAPSGWDLPSFPRFKRDKPVAVVRPVTERQEWFNSARNPRPEYVAQIAAELMRDYHVVSVADLADKHEWLMGTAPPAHEQLHRGELGVRKLLGLIQSANVVVGGVGWIVPACIAAGTPLFCILGGHGGHNAPAKITDSRMDLSHVRFAAPDRFCGCDQMRHACDKTNTHLGEQWAAWRRESGV